MLGRREEVGEEFVERLHAKGGVPIVEIGELKMSRLQPLFTPASAAEVLP
jgi:hypothetical protein